MLGVGQKKSHFHGTGKISIAFKECGSEEEEKQNMSASEERIGNLLPRTKKKILCPWRNNINKILSNSGAKAGCYKHTKHRSATTEGGTGNSCTRPKTDTKTFDCHSEYGKEY